MKKILGTLLIIAMAMHSHGQMMLTLGNQDNSNPSPTATSGGLYFINPGTGAVLMNYPEFININITLFGGPVSGSLSFITTIAGTDLSTYGYLTTQSPGQFFDFTSTAYDVPGVAPGDTVRLRQQVWLGSAPDFATAVVNGDFTAQVDWLNPTGGGGGPPAPPVSFVDMPAVVLGVPEPASLSLAGLGAAAWLLRRRR